MDAIKGLVITALLLVVGLVALTQLPQTRGMPLEAQLSHLANSTLQYINELAAPLVNMFYRYFG